MWRDARRIWLTACAALLFGACHEKSDNDVTSETPPALNTELAATVPASTVVLAYQARLASNAAPALPLELTGDAATAQQLALSHPPLAAQLRINGEKLRAEVMSVAPLRESDFTSDSASCRQSRCFRIEIFDFARNTTLLGVADLGVAEIGQQQKMLSWRADVGRQAEVPDRLKSLAISLAIESAEVKEALGGVTPKFSDAQMASTKSALNGTRCERSKHLCVAPTFVQGNIAIWAIVDLTDFQLVGVQWTDVGNRSEVPPSVAIPSEQSLSDAAIMAHYCERNTELERLGWKLNYMLTASDGLRVSEVFYKGKALLESAKLVDWHVSYSDREGFGYSDAVGCPSFSSAAVLPFVAPKVTDITVQGTVVGFRLEQEFRSLGWPAACNYSYRQSFEFYADGSFRPTAASIGAGCGNDGTYRPVLRVAPKGNDWQLENYEQDTFKPVISERYFEPEGATDSKGARFLLRNSQFSFQIEPGRGQFADNRGDHEWVFATADRIGRDEGATDLITIGPCCNTDFQQGPEQFLDTQPEALNGALVFWYVPQLKNDTREGYEYCWARNIIVNGVIKVEAFPCIAGPMFRAIPVAAKS